MVSISPVPSALVPLDSDAASRISAPNYDEFQGDHEVFALIQSRPDCVLRITMAHCDVDDFDERLDDGSPEALELAKENFDVLVASDDTRVMSNLLWVYEIVSPRRLDVRQMGLGGFGQTNEIRTDDNPGGVIVRNEGIRPEKAEGRARLIQATNSYIGTVNCAVRDREGQLLNALESYADAREPNYTALDEAGNTHRVWLVTKTNDVERFTQLLAEEPLAYVADGNHRSAAAAALKKEHFLAVFFPTDRLHLEPYNRLVEDVGLRAEVLLERLKKAFTIKPLGALPTYRPDHVHTIGLYTAGTWYELTPQSHTFDAANAAESIDADIVQRHVFDAALGMTDARDARLNFVGGNKDSAYLKARVDAGEYAFAISFAPVTMDQFIAVCEQNRFMPPKSTWFDPKIRSGLVMALL
ncbi:MAG: DUF1015 domain-containing protein [Planctomycetaceae bacterium]|nr:DUF1015 domain-containing protein [Planctomycetaceae bacterium]